MTQKRLRHPVLTGLPPFDAVTAGLQPGEVWMHAGLVGHVKSTWALNWALNALLAGVNVAFASFEKPSADVERALIGLYKCLDRHSVRRREMDQTEISMLRDGEMTLRHKGLPGRFEAVASWGPVRMRDLARAEFPVDLLIVDGSQLVTTGRETKTEAARLREVYVEAKRLALGLDGERPIGVVMIQQLSRTGVSDVGEIYESAFDEKILESVDVVTTSWQDVALAHYGRALFSMVKNRDGRLAEPFLVGVDPKTRRMAWEDPDEAIKSTVGLNERGEASVYDNSDPEMPAALDRLIQSCDSEPV